MSKLGSTSTPLIKKGKLHLGKLIKTCVQPPPGWIFCGLDFDSLEDKISALTTKDKNKLAVYTQNYDGHCLRAYSYFGEHMPDIQLATEKERCFLVKVGGEDAAVKWGTLVACPDGQIRKVEDYFELATNKRLS